jgi:hypothetical protein
MKKKHLCICVALILVIAVIPFSGSAGSNPDEVDLDNPEIADLINNQYNVVIQDDMNIDMEASTVAAIIDDVEADKARTKTSKGQISSIIENQIVTIDQNNAETINISTPLMNDENQEFSIELPLESATADIEDGVIIAEDADSGFKTTTEIVEGGVRNTFIIESSDAPSIYPIEYTFGEEALFSYGIDENGTQ